MLSLATVERLPTGCRTIYADGASWEGHAHDTPHYHVIAHRCGYGDDLAAYAFEHDACHSIVAERLGPKIRASAVLWPLAHGHSPDAAESLLEEFAAQALQRWLRAAERPILGGVDWDALKRETLEWLLTL